MSKKKKIEDTQCTFKIKKDKPFKLKTKYGVLIAEGVENEKEKD